MEALQKESYTVEDIFALPDGVRAELFDGQIYYMSPPSTRHQTLVMSISYAIKDYINKKGGACKVLPAPLAVFLSKDSHNYVEPDISVICDNSKLTEKGCNGAPDWTIEIVSPSSRYVDYYKKLSKYGESGVKEYWIVDPDKENVTVYNFENSTVEEYSFNDDIPAGIYGDLTIKLNN